MATTVKPLNIGVEKVHRVKLVKGDKIALFSYIVDIYNNLTFVTGKLKESSDYTIYQTSHGKLVIDNGDDVRVKDGEIYRPSAGLRIDHLMNALLKFRMEDDDPNMTAEFNSVEFSIYKSDTLDSLYERYDTNLANIRAKTTKSYSS